MKTLVNIIVMPLYPPDLNMIENIRAIMKRKIVEKLLQL